MRIRYLVLIFTLAIVFAFSESAFCTSGSPEGDNCVNPPSKILKVRKTRIVTGRFTAALENVKGATSYFTIHMMLKKGSNVHLYSFPFETTTPGDPCLFTECDMKTWRQGFNTDIGAKPCMIGVADDFGYFGYIPVISSIKNMQTDRCGTPHAMLAGEVTIFLVPSAKSVP